MDEENQALRQRIAELEAEVNILKGAQEDAVLDFTPPIPLSVCEQLNNDEIKRYSRHLILPEVGVDGQKKLRSSSALVVGAGGLGSSAILYLAAAGFGRIGIVDHDTIEMSNLQRQIIHSEARVGTQKVQSAKWAAQGVNSDVDVKVYPCGLNSINAMKIVPHYDIILDATDNVATRYLVNDAAVLSGKPLVSGSALQMEGQATVYGMEGPCYRCLYPKPPPPETVTNCNDGGVLGVVPGLIGCIQALEACKIAMGQGSSLSQKLLLFDAMSLKFRQVKLRGPNLACEACGENPIISSDKLVDYVQFCGAAPTDKDHPQDLPSANLQLAPENRISAREYHKVAEEGSDHILVDVRPTHHFEICSIPGSENIPLSELGKHMDILKSKGKPVYCVCRRGIDSQLATRKLRDQGFPKVYNVDGGLLAWTRDVDNKFPVY